ncbi:MAG: hypothetical protein M3P30_08290 [Chloroflexota bacterium]|nr:hypothetical protein [Chloroflexota bacterium]
MTRIFVSIVVLGALALGGWHVTGASAAKPEPLQVSADCGADGTLIVQVSQNNGTFSAAHIVGGGTFIPVAFSNQHGTFTDTEGNVFTEDPPDVSHRTPANKDILSCHFTITIEDDSGSGTFSGDVQGFVVGTH